MASSNSHSDHFANDIEQILSANDLKQIQQNVLHRMQQQNADSNDRLHHIEFYEAIKAFVAKKKNKLELDQKETFLQCFDFVFCAIFAKQMDLLRHVWSSKAYKAAKIIRDDEVKEFVIAKIATNIISKYNAM